VIDMDMNTNFYGTLRVIRTFMPGFINRGSGIIANIVSIAGLAPVPLLAGYSASKAALQSLTQALRATLAESGDHRHRYLPRSRGHGFGEGYSA